MDQIEVGMGDLKINRAPNKLITRALGSCLGITFYCPQTKTGAMAHPMLPDINKARIKTNPNRYVNSVVLKALEDMERLGSPRLNLEIKLFGGAHMFSFIASDSILNVGEKNIETAKTLFSQLGIKISAEEVGGTFGRTIELNLENGSVFVDTVSWGRKVV